MAIMSINVKIFAKYFEKTNFIVKLIKGERMNRKWWFNGLKGFLKIFIRKPKFVFLGKVHEENTIILSNHVGASAPVLLELYFKQPFRFWGTHEMTEGLRSVYKYLSTTYLHDKKHFSKAGAKILAFFICPFVNLFYKGLKLIPTYRDTRLKKTMTESLTALKNKENIIIFPEDSSHGYFDDLTKFFPGFITLAKAYLKRGSDSYVQVIYYAKKHRTFIVDKSVKFSELVDRHANSDELAMTMCARANQLHLTYEKHIERKRKRKK